MPVERTLVSDRAFRIVANHKIRAAGTEFPESIRRRWHHASKRDSRAKIFGSLFSTGLVE